MDTRFPVQWLLDRRVQQLSDAHHRAFVNSLVWSVANRTDGRVDRDDLALIPGMTDDAAAALVRGRLWTAGETGWLIADFEATQTSRAEHEILERARQREREKKARQRAAKAAEEEPAGLGVVPGDSPQGSPGGRVPGTAQAGRQEGRQGQEGEQQAKIHARENANGAEPSDGSPDWPIWRGAGADPFAEYR